MSQKVQQKWQCALMIAPAHQTGAGETAANLRKMAQSKTVTTIFTPR
jgi:hypothetical protein